MLENTKKQIECIKSNMDTIINRAEGGNLTPTEIETYSKSIQLSADFLVMMCNTIDELIPNEYDYRSCDVCGKPTLRSELQIAENKYHCKECYHDLLARYGI